MRRCSGDCPDFRRPGANGRQLDPLLRQLRGVDDDDEDLRAFLGALSDGSFDRTTPRRVPSGLAVGGRIR
jgi:cytochrome c peroxidase